jgi:hypothetical protein
MLLKTGSVPVWEGPDADRLATCSCDLADGATM